ncbi:MAG: hypothetical protein EHM21_04210 [Chloroflexi bacterium]|nr:MAG: hypothetical protein EHM21_04210 [Chloroflexota bacterium]
MDRNRFFRLILGLYGLLLWLYPPRFRETFAEEQRQVFEDALEESRASAGRLFLRELMHLPGVLLRCYWAAFRSGGWQSLLKGAAIFLIFMLQAVFFMERFGIVFNYWMGYAILGTLAAVVLAGIVMGFPRWALPYVGFLMPWLLLQVTNNLVDWIGRHMPRRDYSLLPLWPRLGLSMMWEGVRLAPVLTILFSAIILLRILPLLLPRGWLKRLPKGWQRTRRWSDLAFLLYGTILAFAIFAFDEYRHNQWYSLTASAFLLVGATGFLTARSQRRAVIALLGATTLAFLTISVGKWMIVPLQTWDGWLNSHPMEMERRFEALSVIVTLFWMWVLLLIPLGWRPFIENPIETGAQPGSV